LRKKAALLRVLGERRCALDLALSFGMASEFINAGASIRHAPWVRCELPSSCTTQTFRKVSYVGARNLATFSSRLVDRWYHKNCYYDAAETTRREMTAGACARSPSSPTPRVSLASCAYSVIR
jgi:hypothetical protein